MPHGPRGGLENLFYRAYFEPRYRGRIKLYVPVRLLTTLQQRVADYPGMLAEGGANYWDCFQLIPVSDAFWHAQLRFQVFPVRHHQHLSAFGLGLSGLFLFTGDRRNGLITTFVTPASIVPRQPRLVVGIANHHYTHELIEHSGTLTLHLLKASQLDWVWRFGTQSGRTIDKFSTLETRRARHDSPVLVDAMAWVEGVVEAKMDT